MEEAARDHLGESPERREVLVVAGRLARERDVDGVVEVVAPLRVEPVAVRLARGDELRVVEVGLRDERERTPDVRGQHVDLHRELLEEVRRRVVHERVHRIQAQRVDVVVAEPHERVVDDVLADGAGVLAVEVEAGSPRVRRRLVEVRAVDGQVVPRRAEVVVDDVLHHAEAAGVARVDEALVGLGSAVGLLHRVPEDPVVAPVVRAVEAVDRQHLHEVDPERDEVVEAVDRGVERAVGREGPDVHLVDDGAGELATGPRLVGPGERRRVVRPRAAVDALGLATRARIRQRRLRVVHEVAVVEVAGGQGLGAVGVEGPPAVPDGRERQALVAHGEREGAGLRGPDVEAVVGHARLPGVRSAAVDAGARIATG